MAEFGPESVEAVLAACNEGAAEAAEALGRAFDGEFTLQVGAAATLDLENPPEELNGPGFLVLLQVDDVVAAAVMPESDGLLPEWYKTPDATGVSRMATLAQELGMVLLPEEFMPLNFAAGRVENIVEALRAGEAADGAPLAPMGIASGDASGRLLLIWPLAKFDGVIPEPKSEEPEPESAPAPSAAAEEASPEEAVSPPSPTAGRIQYADLGDGLRQLPPYSRSLLRIKVPVVVTLASTKQPVARVLDLGPGSIIQFDKSCEETLSLEVGGQAVADGEAVKVGDKFGLRITSMTLPEERFFAVLGHRE